MKFRPPSKEQRQAMIKEHLRIVRLLGVSGKEEQRNKALTHMLKKYKADFGEEYEE